MSDTAKCPYCKNGDLVEGAGKLDQSGDQYLPCKVVACCNEYGGCGYRCFLKPEPGTEPRVSHKPTCEGYCKGCVP